MAIKFPMDLSKFKTVERNEHTATLRHPQGHEIKIAVGALDPKMRKHLDSIPMEKKQSVKMAEGGKASKNDIPEPDPSKAAEFVKGATASGAKPASEYWENIKEGINPQPTPTPIPQPKRQNYADGGETINLNASDQNIDDKKLENYAADEQAKQAVEPNFDPGAGIIPTVSGMQPAPQNPLVDPNQITFPVDPQAPASGAQPPAPPAGIDREIASSSPQAEAGTQQAPAVGSASKAAASQMPSLEGGYNQQMQGIQQSAAASGALGKQQSAILEDAAKAKQQQIADFQQQYQALNKERLAHIADIQKGHVDPDKYWENHSKLAAGIGIILAGFNPKGSGGNAALDFINHNIERSIQAQAKNLDSDQNLLTANLHQFGNMKDAESMTRVMMNDVIANKLDNEVAKAQDPMAKARALELKGQLQRQAVPEFMNMAMRKALIQASNQQGGQASGAQGNPEQMLGYLRVVNPEAAKEMETRYVPHVGFASVPISEKIREEIGSRQSLQDQIHNLRQWSAQHQGTLNPEEVNYGKALASSVQDAYRRANGQGVFRESEANFVKGIVADDPTAFFNKLRVDPKYKALEDSNMAALNGVKKSYGLPESTPMSRLSPQQKQFVDWAKANPNNPKSAILLKKLGIE